MLVTVILTPDGKPMPGYLTLQGLHSLRKRQLEAMANKPRRLFRTLQTLLSTRQASMLSKPSRLVREHRTLLEAMANKPRRMPRTLQTLLRTRQASMVSRPSRPVRAHRTLLLTTLNRPGVLSKTVRSQRRTRRATLVRRASRLGMMPRAQHLSISRQQIALKPRHSLLRAQQEAITSKPRMLFQVPTWENLNAGQHVCSSLYSLVCCGVQITASVPNVWHCTNQVQFTAAYSSMCALPALPAHACQAAM